MSNSELYYNNILKILFVSIDSNNKEFKISELLTTNNALDEYRETDIRKALYWGIEQGIIKAENKDTNEMSFIFQKVDWEYNNVNTVEIAISAPHIYNLTINRIVDNNEFISTETAFKKILLSANQVIRISSPFFEENINAKNGIENFHDIIKQKLNSGCKVILLSRETDKRVTDLNWIIDIAKSSKFSHNLEIYDFHKLNDSMLIDSSLHAKLIISDESMAYLGSAELRFNSIYKNFESGAVISGPAVRGLIELFDFLTSISKRVY